MSSLVRQGAPTLANALLGTDLYPHALDVTSTGGASCLAGYGCA